MPYEVHGLRAPRRRTPVLTMIRSDISFDDGDASGLLVRGVCVFLFVFWGWERWKKFLLVIAFPYLAYIYTGSYLHYTWSSLHTQTAVLLMVPVLAVLDIYLGVLHKYTIVFLLSRLFPLYVGIILVSSFVRT